MLQIFSRDFKSFVLILIKRKIGRREKAKLLKYIIETFLDKFNLVCATFTIFKAFFFIIKQIFDNKKE